MFIEFPIFPDTPAFGAQGGPRFATTVAPSPSGDEALMAHWPMELGAWTLDQRNRGAAETVILLTFFRVACGRAHGFRFHDWDDDRASQVVIGVGDGIETTFQLVKLYDEGAVTYSRTIVKPVPGTVLVWLDGTPTTAFSVSSATGLVTMDAPPAADVVVTASFQFHVPVRFDLDAMSITCVDPNAFTWPQIRLVECESTDVLEETTAPLMLAGRIIHDEDWVFTGELTWPVPGLGGEPLVGYRLYRRAGNGLTPPTVLLSDTTAPPTQIYLDAETAVGGIADGVRTGGYTYALTVYTALEESPQSNLVWLYLDPDVPPSVVGSGAPLVGASAGTGFCSTHYVEITLDWTLGGFLGGEPAASTKLYRSFYPDDPVTLGFLVGTFLPAVTSYTEDMIFGNYQGGPSGVTLIPVGTPALDAYAYEETLRGDGYNYAVVTTSVTGRTVTSPVQRAQHMTAPPTAPRNVTVSFHEAGEFFSYYDMAYDAPAETGGAGVWFYFAERNDDGAGWVPYAHGLSGEFLLTPVDGGLSFEGTTGFADRPGTFQLRVQAQNDWGTSGWATSNIATAPPYVP